MTTAAGARTFIPTRRYRSGIHRISPTAAKMENAGYAGSKYRNTRLPPMEHARYMTPHHTYSDPSRLSRIHNPAIRNGSQGQYDWQQHPRILKHSGESTNTRHIATDLVAQKP